MDQLELQLSEAEAVEQTARAAAEKLRRKLRFRRHAQYLGKYYRDADTDMHVVEQREDGCLMAVTSERGADGTIMFSRERVAVSTLQASEQIDGNEFLLRVDKLISEAYALTRGFPAPR